MMPTMGQPNYYQAPTPYRGILFSSVRTLADMTEKEIEAIEKEYGALVLRPIRDYRAAA